MRRADPIRVWYLLQSGSALGDTLVWVLAPVYFVKTVGMSPLQLVLVGTFMELSVFVFELPTGIVADVYSRRLSTIVGFLIMGLAMVFVGLMAEAGRSSSAGPSGDSGTRSRAVQKMRGSRTRSG